jgi:hypothetical protein
VPVPPARNWRAELYVLLAWPRILNRLRAVVRSAVTTFVVLTVTLWLMPGVASADVFRHARPGAAGRRRRRGAAPAAAGRRHRAGRLGRHAARRHGPGDRHHGGARAGPGDRISNLPTLVVAAILAVVFAAILDWMADSGTDDSFVKETKRLMRGCPAAAGAAGRRAALHAAPSAAGHRSGMLIVQLDGVAEPVLRWAVRAGNLPTIGHWLRTGSHRMRPWHTGLPSTTPAAQAGILHGASRQIPGFRWYEKDTGKLMVSNRPRDAAVIQRRLSDGTDCSATAASASATRSPATPRSTS